VRFRRSTASSLADPSGPARPSRGATFESFQHRNFRLYFGGQLISQTGNWLTRVAQTLLVLHLTNDGFAIGVLAACQFGPILILGPWAGLVADRSDKRRLLIKVQSFAMLQSFALAALAFMDRPPLMALYLVALVGGVTLAFDNPARRTFVVEMVPRASRQNAVSLNNALMMSARIVGPALAGLLVTLVGYGWCFVIDATSYIAVVIGLAMISLEKGSPSVAAVRARGQIREGLRYVRSQPDLLVPLTMMTVTGTLAFNLNVALPLFAINGLGGSDSTFTMLYAVLSVGSLGGALAAARRTTADLRYIASAAGVFGVAMLVFAAAPNAALAYVFAVPVGFAMMTYSTAASTIVQMRSRGSMRGRVVALQAMVIQGTTAIGGPLIGALCDRFGGRAGLGVGGAAAVATGVFGAQAARSVGRDAVAVVEGVAGSVVEDPSSV